MILHDNILLIKIFKPTYASVVNVRKISRCLTSEFCGHLQTEFLIHVGCYLIRQWSVIYRIYLGAGPSLLQFIHTGHTHITH